MYNQEILTALKLFNHRLELMGQALDRLSGVKHIKVNYIPSEQRANYGYVNHGVANRGWRRWFKPYAIPPRYGKQFLGDI